MPDNEFKAGEKAWEMLESYAERPFNEKESGELILELCKTIEFLRKELNWYGEGNNVVSTWYSRSDVGLCLTVENSKHWRSLGNEDREYIEDGHRAYTAAYKAELPENTIEKLTLKLNKEGK